MKIKFALGALALAASAFAAQANAAGATIGGSIASSRVNGSNFEGDDVGWKAYAGGYGKIFGIEGGYVDFGDVGGVGDPGLTAWTPALVVGVPVGVVNIYGKIGEAFYTIEETFLRPEIKDEEMFYGVGVRAGGETGLGARVEYERFDIGDADVDLVSAGLEFRF
jgi:hypothetical protein